MAREKTGDQRRRERLRHYRREYARLKTRLREIGFICEGTLVERWMQCGKPQYCSLKDVNAFCDAETLAWHLVSRPQRVFAHLALHAARIPSFAAGDHAFFEYFVKNRVMQVFSRPRGEWRPRPIAYGELHVPHEERRVGPGLPQPTMPLRASTGGRRSAPAKNHRTPAVPVPGFCCAAQSDAPGDGSSIRQTCFLSPTSRDRARPVLRPAPGADQGW